MRKITKITITRTLYDKELARRTKHLLPGYCSKRGSRIASLLILHPPKELILFPSPDEKTKAWGCKGIYHAVSTRQARDWSQAVRLRSSRSYPLYSTKIDFCAHRKLANVQTQR